MTAHRLKSLAAAVVIALIIANCITTVHSGNDFLMFYTSGWMVLHGQTSLLYDAAAHARLGLQFYGKYWATPLSYGPQVALFFAPLGVLPYWLASLVWKLITLGIYVGCCYALWRACPTLRAKRNGAITLAVALASPALRWDTLFGQTSVLVLLIFVLVYRYLGTRPFVAGLLIGLLAYKPQFGIVAACVFLITAQWRVVAGAIASIAAQWVLTASLLGQRVFLDYARALGQQLAKISQDDSRYLQQLHSVGPFSLSSPLCPLASLRSFWQIVLPSHAALPYIFTAVALLVLTIFAWRQGHTPFKLKFALLLLATVLVSPHAFAYDLVILVPAFLFAEEWLLAGRGKLRHLLRAVVYASFVLPAFAAQTALSVAMMTCFALLLGYGMVTERRRFEEPMREPLLRAATS